MARSDGVQAEAEERREQQVGQSGRASQNDDGHRDQGLHNHPCDLPTIRRPEEVPREHGEQAEERVPDDLSPHTVTDPCHLRTRRKVVVKALYPKVQVVVAVVTTKRVRRGHDHREIGEHRHEAVRDLAAGPREVVRRLMDDDAHPVVGDGAERVGGADDPPHGACTVTRAAATANWAATSATVTQVWVVS